MPIGLALADGERRVRCRRGAEAAGVAPLTTLPMLTVRQRAPAVIALSAARLEPALRFGLQLASMLIDGWWPPGGRRAAWV